MTAVRPLACILLALAFTGLSAARLTAEAAVSRPPAAPSHLTAQVLSPVEVLLSWKDESTDETEVQVEVRTIDSEFADVGAVFANATAAILQGLEPATRYVFRVRAGRGRTLRRDAPGRWLRRRLW